MVIMGIDPGTEQSAMVVWNNEIVINHIQCSNIDFLQAMRNGTGKSVNHVVIEDVAFYGKVLNKSTFDTLKLIGRIQEIFPDKHSLVYFPDIAYHFCNSRRGVNTAQINKVLISRFGEKGTKKNPGILYGIKEHEWSALAVAVYYADKIKEKS
jgi:hypothetical protein